MRLLLVSKESDKKKLNFKTSNTEFSAHVSIRRTNAQHDPGPPHTKYGQNEKDKMKKGDGVVTADNSVSTFHARTVNANHPNSFVSAIPPPTTGIIRASCRRAPDGHSLNSYASAVVHC